MKHIRAIFRLFLILFFTLFSYTLYLAGYAALSVAGARKEPWRNRFMKAWTTGMAFIMGLHTSVLGVPPDPPFFLVSNHLSYIDMIPLYQNLKCTFVAKKEVKSWPVLGFMVKTMGVIFIDRNRKTDVKRVNNILSKELNSKQGIVLFPEGGTSDGTKIQPFRSPLLHLPANSNLPVHYVSIYYKTGKNDLPARESVCWHRSESFPVHLYRFLKNRRTDCTLTFGEKSISHTDRKILTEKLFKAVSKQFKSMAPG